MAAVDCDSEVDGAVVFSERDRCADLDSTIIRADMSTER
jgi:hypothetical protein